MTLTNADVRKIIEGTGDKVDPQALLDWIIAAPTTGEDYQAGCDAMAAAMGLYAYCSLYHGGQGSDLYRILCTLTRPGMFKPGPDGDKLDPDEDEDAIAVYAALGGNPEDFDPEDDPLDLLEELLSLTEPMKDRMTPEQRDAWQDISARAADLRDGADV